MINYLFFNPETVSILKLSIILRIKMPQTLSFTGYRRDLRLGSGGWGCLFFKSFEIYLIT